jgi:hypothetical protein
MRDNAWVGLPVERIEVHAGRCPGLEEMQLNCIWRAGGGVKGSLPPQTLAADDEQAPAVARRELLPLLHLWRAVARPSLLVSMEAVAQRRLG